MHETRSSYRRKENAEHDDHRQYSVFMTNRGSGHLTEYGYRWEIESGYKRLKRFMAATTQRISCCVFLLRIRLSAVLGLADGRFAHAVRS